MLTFSITTGTEPWLRRTNSCCTMAPERTLPKSKRASEKEVFGCPEATPVDESACLTVAASRDPEGDPAGDDPQETRSGRNKNKVLLVATRINKALPTNFHQSRDCPRLRRRYSP